MISRIREGTVVLSQFNVIKLSASDALYQHAEAIRSADGGAVRLQILTALLAEPEVTLLRDYFITLQGVHHKDIDVPTQVLSASDYPLVVVYPALNAGPLIEVLKREPEQASKYWRQASELLFDIHKKKIVHGRVSPECFKVADDTVRLSGFGYAPLLQSGNKAALEACRALEPPEVLAKGELTAAADVYAFGHTVAKWLPAVKESIWFRKATHPDPSLRFRRMREAFDELETFLSHELKGEAFSASAEPIGMSGGGLIPKAHFNIEAIVKPAVAGSVVGTGAHLKGESGRIEAIARPGWQFDHWSGAFSGSSNPLSFSLSEDKNVTAHFVKVAAVTPAHATTSPGPAPIGASSVGTSVARSTTAASGTPSSTKPAKPKPASSALPYDPLETKNARKKLYGISSALAAVILVVVLVGKLVPQLQGGTDSGGSDLGGNGDRGAKHPVITKRANLEARASMLAAQAEAQRESQTARQLKNDAIDNHLHLRKLAAQNLLTTSEIATEKSKQRTLFNESLQHCEKALKANPNNQLAWEVKVAALYMLEQFQDAHTAVSQGLSRFPRSVDLKDAQIKINQKLNAPSYDSSTSSLPHIAGKKVGLANSNSGAANPYTGHHTSSHGNHKSAHMQSTGSVKRPRQFADVPGSQEPLTNNKNTSSKKWGVPGDND
jgi:hypothetical protein